MDNNIKHYLLDTNIVIGLWDKNPNLFDLLDKTNNIDYKITSRIMLEISQKEFLFLGDVPFNVTERFAKLMKHYVQDIYSSGDPSYRDDRFFKSDENGIPYIIKGNISTYTDKSLIVFCQNNNDLTLVTNDKRLIKCAKLILGDCRVLNLFDFLKEVEKFIQVD